MASFNETPVNATTVIDEVFGDILHIVANMRRFNPEERGASEAVYSAEETNDEVQNMHLLESPQ